MVSVEDPARRATGQGAPPVAADQRPPSGPLRTAWTVFTGALAAAGTIGSLIADDNGRILLGLVAIAGLVAFGRQLLTTRARQAAAQESTIGELRAQNASQEQQNAALRAEIAVLRDRDAANGQALRQARTAIERIVDRQFPLFTEEVEITIVIGEDGGDVVIERHRTVPKPHVPYRVLRPITATTGRSRPSFDELELTCEVEGNDADASVQVVSETAEGPLVLVLFQPGLRKTEEWTLRYKAPLLWEPLRRDGIDRLCWAPSTRDGREQTIPITALAVNFVFPPGARSFAVRECHDLGDSVREPDEHRVTWRDPALGVHWYEWELWWSRAD
ncbi:MAG TPA: hypothetical protein VH573_09370 [Mycobacteriales bacterium]|jgi:hypothetical protein